MREIAVGGEDRAPAADGDRTNQKIDESSLHASRSAAVEVRRRLFVVRRVDFDIEEGAKVQPEFFELPRASDARKQLLANHAEQ